MKITRLTVEFQKNSVVRTNGASPTINKGQASTMFKNVNVLVSKKLFRILFRHSDYVTYQEVLKFYAENFKLDNAQLEQINKKIGE